MNITTIVDTDRLFSEEAFSIYAPCMYQPTYEAYRTLIKGFVSNPSIKVFVREVHGAIIGILVLRRVGAAIEIVGIAVSAAYRHRGIGRAMIHDVMASEHLECVKAETDDDAVGFYRKCGSSVERIIKEYPDGIAVRYRCTLRR